MRSNNNYSAKIYTDGSCHTQHRVGAWVAILLIGGDKVVLSGVAENTTHNRMELLAVIRAIEYIKTNHPAIESLIIGSDSQYVVGLPGRTRKLKASGFANKKGLELQNAGLVKEFLELTAGLAIEWTKIKAHSLKNGLADSKGIVYKEGVSNDMGNDMGGIYNKEADLLSRKLVRESVANKGESIANK